ncbi:MAG: ribosome biogenesis GTPase YqeH [Bacilli bacterium]|nr:ribosome biogenesis GTPase YqeH [Bacilli bacterium]MBQ3468880.1 ribosome biogenesis GTPase YqeH [Bacilli bacterium]
MSKKCLGCGIELQDENVLNPGYTTNLDYDFCQRCFRLKNYGDYQVVDKSNEEYINILKKIDKTNDLVLYVVDILNIPENLKEIKEYVHNKMILVINKKDAIPKSVKDEKIINYFKDMNLFEEVIVVSANKNYNIDYLLSKIKFHQITKDVYIIGYTNAGKSTLINKIMNDYSDNDANLSISALPSTTLDVLRLDVNDHLTLVDTPGVVSATAITNFVSDDILKRINPKKEIKPKTYQMRKNQAVLIEDLVRVDYIEGIRNSFTVFVANSLKVRRMLNNRHDDLKNLSKRTYETNFSEDLVIEGLGFIKIMERGVIEVYVDKDVKTYLRKSLI